MKKRTSFTGGLLAAALAVTLLPASSVSAANAEPGTEQLIVRVKSGKDINSIAAQYGAKLKKTLLQPEFKVLTVPSGKTQAVIAKLKADPNIESVDVDEVLHMNTTIPNDPAFPSQYHLQIIQAPQAWDTCRGDRRVKIAILDTGIQTSHPDLRARIDPGYDFVNNDTDADDDQGHGTFVAGIAAAHTNNGLNGAGIDWHARLMPIKVLNSSGSGYTSDIIDGVYYAADNGAKVINMSFSGSSYNTAFQTAINYAWSKGAVIVAAAGNNGTTAVQYPAAYNNVLSVASSTSSDTPSSFSSYGTWVDIAAPGSSIYSSAYGGGMTTMSGTSMASAVVSGVLGLVWGRLLTSPTTPVAGPTPTTVLNKVMSTTDSITGTGTYWAAGRINAYKACTQ